MNNYNYRGQKRGHGEWTRQAKGNSAVTDVTMHLAGRWKERLYAKESEKMHPTHHLHQRYVKENASDDTH